MPKKIGYFLHDFEPNREALSKEVQLLKSEITSLGKFQSVIHDISTKWRFNFSRHRVTYPHQLLPIGWLATLYLQRQSDLVHIFGSVTGRTYLRMLYKRPAILTNASAIHPDRVENCKKYWSKLDRIIVESTREKSLLQRAGVAADRVQLVYPGVHIAGEGTALPEGKTFKILFASAPISDSTSEFFSKGLLHLLEAAKELRNCEITLLWRQKHTEKIQKHIHMMQLENIILRNEIISDMRKFCQQFHAVLLAPATEDACKPCPLSLVEALALGKPVIASKFIGIANLIEEEGCGVVSRGDTHSLVAAIDDLRSSYAKFQKRCLATAEKHFSTQQFLVNYAEIYRSMLS